MSSSLPCPSRKPPRAPRITCGAWLMFSMPPTRHVVASSNPMEWTPLITDWMPEPQRRLTVRAGLSIGTPALSSTWRAP